MSITNERLETLASNLNQLISESHNPPRNAEDVIRGMDCIRDLYLENVPTERNAELIIALTEVLFYNYPEFGSAFIAVAKALAGSQYAEAQQLLTTVGPNATFGDMARSLGQ
jgi:hypothetical protein